MKPLAALLPLLVLLSIPVPLPAAEQPECALTVTAPKAKIALGEKIDLAIKLEKKKGKPVETNVLRLARNSVSLRVTAGGAERVVTRIYGVTERVDEKTFVVKDAPSPTSELKRGKPLTATVPFIALLPGENRVKAVYGGLPGDKPALESEEVVLTVEAPKEGAKVGAVVETSEGPITFELRPDRAYNTVFNFLALAMEQRYDNLTFHRIMRGFMVQGGDPKGDGTGGPGWTIPAEFDATLKHEVGVISMARSNAVDSAGSQFFVMHGAKPGLDGLYAAFGKLVEGKEALELLASTEVVARSGTNPPELSKPKDPPVIRTVKPLVR